jgi:hypothetical protein
LRKEESRNRGWRRHPGLGGEIEIGTGLEKSLPEVARGQADIPVLAVWSALGVFCLA